jgi:hypothetical protein
LDEPLLVADSTCFAGEIMAVVREHWVRFVTLVPQTVSRRQGVVGTPELGALADKSVECWWEAELSRLKAEQLPVCSAEQHAEAESCFRQSHDVARRQQATPWGLRSAMRPARLWQQQGQRDEARQRLAPIDGGFTAGFETADLQAAKAVLEERS